MCEKIREGKVLSPPSDGDIDESFPRDWKPIKKTKKKKRSPKRTKVCKSCSRNITKLQKRDLMRYTNKYDQELAKEYCKEHERAYGFSAPGEPVEIVAIRLTAVGDIAKPTLREIGKTSGGVDAARRTTRSVYFAESKGFVDCPVYDRYKLSSGDVLQGPAIIEEMDSRPGIY